MRWRFWAYWLVPLWVSCTQDFSAFGFDHAGATRKNPARTPDASTTAPGDAASDSAPADSAPAEPSDSGESTQPPSQPGAGQQPPPSAANAGHAAPTPDNPDKPAGQVDSMDGGSEDAGSVDSRAPECAASWSELPFPKPSTSDISDASDLPRSDPPSAACQSCSCTACASAILDCLHTRSPVERGLCRDMLACALRERCQEYDCYCASTGCGFPDGIGDGPCAEEINAAAGGTRSRVIALRNADPPDPKEPLVRAAQAIACIFGEHPNSPGPSVAGNCEQTCQ